MKIIPKILLIAVAVFTVYRSYNYAPQCRDFEFITAEQIAERLNSVATCGATVLCYEVQYRYWLRSDIKMLSLDGITDGKVDLSDIDTWVKKERPEYYIPFDAKRTWYQASGLKRLDIPGVEFVGYGYFYHLVYH